MRVMSAFEKNPDAEKAEQSAPSAVVAGHGGKPLPVGAAQDKPLSAAALRALAEAEERRRAENNPEQDGPRELNGPRGIEPTRYGDWERKGVAYDF